MGYKNKSKTYTLQFKDRDGLEVVTKGATVAEIEKMTDLGKAVDQAKDRNDHQLATMRLFDFFAGKIISWNIEHSEVIGGGECSICGLSEDDLIPVSGDNMQCMEFDFVTEIITGWITAIVSVALPKGWSLNSGENSGLSPLRPDTTNQLTATLAQLQNPLTLREPNFTSE
jgi:hypothetical protein